MIFTRQLYGDTQQIPLGHPFHFPRQFAVAIKGGNPARMAATSDIFGGIRLAGVKHLRVLVIRYHSGGNLAAVLTNYLKRVPILSTMGAADLQIGLPHQVGIFQEGINMAV